MVTGFLTFKAVTIGAALVGSFIALKGAITGATIAQTGLNVANVCKSNRFNCCCDWYCCWWNYSY